MIEKNEEAGRGRPVSPTKHVFQQEDARSLTEPGRPRPVLRPSITPPQSSPPSRISPLRTPPSHLHTFTLSHFHTFRENNARKKRLHGGGFFRAAWRRRKRGLSVKSRSHGLHLCFKCPLNAICLFHDQAFFRRNQQHAVPTQFAIFNPMRCEVCVPDVISHITKPIFARGKIHDRRPPAVARRLH